MDENNTNPSCNTRQPIVTYVLIFLNIMLSLGKQFLNNNKHIKLNSNVDSILTGIRQEKVMNTNNIYTNPLNTEGEGFINLNSHLNCLFFSIPLKINPLENITNPKE